MPTTPEKKIGRIDPSSSTEFQLNNWDGETFQVLLLFVSGRPTVKTLAKTFDVYILYI